MPNQSSDTSTAKVFINKLEAARRQLDAAIRMTFDDEDELAIHTVAAAAYRILRDLLHKRGRSDLKEIMAVGMYSTAKDFASGELSEDKLEKITGESPYVRNVFVEIAREIQKKGDSFTPDNINVRMDSAAQWNRLSATANFLKHADRDSDSHISLDDINNDEIVIRACAAYAMVVGQTPDNLRQTPEMSAFHIWWLAGRDIGQLAQEYGEQIAGKMRRLSTSRRRRACQQLVKTFARWRTDAVGA